MWIILGLLFSFSVFALDTSEELKDVKILKALPDNILLLDRGLEDGILRHDHIMLMSSVAGFSSRAICIQAKATTSYWRLYRIPNASAISQDYTYSLVGINDREIPMPVATVRDKLINIPEPEKAVEAKDPGPDPFKVTADLPEKLSERDLIEAMGPEKRKLFVEETLDMDQLGRDLKDYRLSIYASPFTRQSINEGESLRYGFQGGNIASKYRLLTQFEQQSTKLKDPVTEESVSTRSTSARAQFIIHELSPSISSLSLINYQSTHFSSLGTPKAHWQVGPLGYTWHLYESKTWEYMDLSYIPLYDIRTTDTIDASGNKGTDKTRGLRHGIRFAVKTKINERVALENLLWVRPFQDLSTWALEGDNLNLENDLKLAFNLGKNLYFDYHLIYQKDKLWKELSQLPETNLINSLNLRYDWDL